MAKREETNAKIQKISKISNEILKFTQCTHMPTLIKLG